MYTKTKAQNWVKKHGFHQIKPTHSTAHLHRIRLQNPNKFKRFRTKRIGDGIEFVMGFK